MGSVSSFDKNSLKKPKPQPATDDNGAVKKTNSAPAGLTVQDQLKATLATKKKGMAGGNAAKPAKLAEDIAVNIAQQQQELDAATAALPQATAEASNAQKALKANAKLMLGTPAEKSAFAALQKAATAAQNKVKSLNNTIEKKPGLIATLNNQKAAAETKAQKTDDADWN